MWVSVPRNPRAERPDASGNTAGFFSPRASNSRLERLQHATPLQPLLFCDTASVFETGMTPLPSNVLPPYTPYSIFSPNTLLEFATFSVTVEFKAMIPTNAFNEAVFRLTTAPVAQIPTCEFPLAWISSTRILEPSALVVR
jgi:hypothetical protein